MTLRCDPLLAILIRLGWSWGLGLAEWHLGAQWTPWHPGPDAWQILAGLGLCGWGLWHLAAWLASSVRVDRENGLLWLRRFTWQGQEEREFQLASIRAIALVPQTGPGRYVLPPPRLELRLDDDRLVPLGTIATVFALEGHAQRLALAIGCGVEDLRE